MFDKRAYSKKSKNKRKSNQINPFTQDKDSRQVLSSNKYSTKKPQCSNESENAKAKKYLNFKLANENTNKNVMDYLNMEEYIDSMDLKNRTKYTANLQFEKLDLIRIKKFIHNSNHDVEQGQGDNLKNDEQEFSFKNIIDSNFLDEIDSSTKHATDKINVIDYNNWNYNDQQQASKPKLAKQNEPIDNTKSEYIFNFEASKPGIFVIEHAKNHETYTNTPEYRFNQQTHIKHKTYKHELEDINKLEYIYFDKSESEDEIEDNDKNKHKHTDKVDYIQVPMYEMEKTPAKEKSKLKHTFAYYFSSSRYTIRDTGPVQRN